MSDVWTIRETSSEALSTFGRYAKEFELLDEDGDRFAWYDTYEDAVAGLQKMFDNTQEQVALGQSDLIMMSRSLRSMTGSAS